VRFHSLLYPDCVRVGNCPFGSDGKDFRYPLERGVKFGGPGGICTNIFTIYANGDNIKLVPPQNADICSVA